MRCTIRDLPSPTGEFSEAVKALTRALEAEPRIANAWLIKGFCLFALEQFQDALIAYATSLEIDPDNPHTWFYKGRAHISLDNFDDAVAAFDHALVLEPEFGEAYYYKGIALAKAQKLQNPLQLSSRRTV